MLVLASFAIVCTLLVVLSDQSQINLTGEQTRLVLLVGLAIALATIGLALLLRPRFDAGTVPLRGAVDVTELRKTLLATEAIINAEAQVLVFWEQGQRARVINHSLQAVPGVPFEPADIERFGQWLEPTSAEELKASLDALFADGRSFNLLVRTRSGASRWAQIGRAHV